MGHLQPVFVLHTRDYRETSLLVDLLTQKAGRICVLAKGVRTAKSILRGLLQPFMPLLASWRGKGELPTLRNVEPAGEPFRFQKEILVSGLYLNELLMRVLHRHDPCEQIFELYRQTLERLNSEPLITLRLFEKYLLQAVGYGLHLEAEAETHQPIVAEKCYRFSNEQGFVLVTSTLTQGMVFSGQSLLAIAHDDYSDQNVLRDAKRLMRLALMPLLDGKPIRSRELILQ